MNIDTPRIVNKKVSGYIKDGEKLKLSQEYFVLAFLKYKFPDKYKDAFHSDRPDIQGEKLFVEVTTLDKNTDVQASKEFAKYSEDHDERRIKTIERTGNALRDKSCINVPSLNRGGGYNFESDHLLLEKRVREKIDAAKGYDIRNRTPELALIKGDRPLQEWLEKISSSLETIVNGQEIYKTVYILFPNGCIYIEKGKSLQRIELSQNEYLHLKTIGRMTAEEEINTDDEEWT